MGYLGDQLVKFLKKEDPPPNFSGETATNADDLYRRWLQQGYNPDLLIAKKGGLDLYRNMRNDDQIKACLQLKKSAVITPGWEVESDNEEHGEFIEYCFENMEGSVEGFITSMLSAFDYGYSVHEKVYNYIDSGDYKGKIGIKVLKPKSPTRISFEMDDYGNLKNDGIIQTQHDGRQTRMPVDKFILYSYQKEFDNYYGESDLKSIYRLWFVKTNILKYWAIYLERFSIPIVNGKLSSGRVTEDQKTAFKSLVSNIQSGMSVITPVDMSISLLESQRSDRGVFDQAINALNVGIARGILIPQLTGLVPQAGVGSYGKSETDLKVFDWVLGAIAKQIQEIVNEQLIKQLIDINYGPQAEYPEFKIKPLKQDDKTRIAAAWGEAVARGAVTPTVETQRWIRELLDAPEMSPEEETEVEDAMEAAASPGGAAGDSGLAGGNPSGGQDKTSNYPGGGNQYSVAKTLPGPESRIDWERYEKELDRIEWASSEKLTDAFSACIAEMVKDAKKNSTALKG